MKKPYRYCPHCVSRLYAGKCPTCYYEDNDPDRPAIVGYAASRAHLCNLEKMDTCEQE